MKSLRWVLRELRILYFAAMTLPIMLGAAIAWARLGAFDPGLFALTLLGGVFLQAGTTVTNDFFDIQAEGHEPGWQPIPPQQALQGAVACFVVGALIGLYLAVLSGPLILGLGLVGMITSYIYSAPPVRLSGTGLGELLAGLNLGTLTTVGSFYVQTGHITWEPVVVALPVSLLMAALLALHGFQEEKLIQTGGRSVWKWLGPTAAPAAYGLPALLAFLLVLALVARGALPLAALLALLAAPLAALTAATASQGDLRRAMRSAMGAELLMAALLALGYLLSGIWRA